jgi:hypothetical protein
VAQAILPAADSPNHCPANTNLAQVNRPSTELAGKRKQWEVPSIVCGGVPDTNHQDAKIA